MHHDKISALSRKKGRLLAVRWFESNLSHQGFSPINLWWRVRVRFMVRSWKGRGPKGPAGSNPAATAIDTKW